MLRSHVLWILLVASTTGAHAQVEDISPRGGIIRHLAASPRNPVLSTALRADGRVLRSADAGATYLETSLVPLTGLVELDWDHSGVAYAATSGALWLSTDGAVNWTSRALPGGSVVAFAASHLQGGELWALDNSGDVYRSLDAGSSWSPTAATGLVGAYGLTLDPAVADRLVVHNTFGIALSDDAGNSWQVSVTPTANGVQVETRSVALPGSRIVLYGGAPEFGYLTEFVHTSDDMGATWTERFAEQTFESTATLAQDPASPCTLYFAGARVGFVRSDDSGTSWTRVRPPINLVKCDAVAFPAGTSDRVLYATNYGVLRSDSLTEPFAFAGGDLDPISVFDAEQDPTDPDHIVASTWMNPIESFDRGRTWAEASAEVFEARFNLEFDRGGALYAVSHFETLLRREQGSWESLGSFGFNTSIVDIDVGEQDPNLIVTVNYDLPEHMLMYSLDRGVTWNERPICGAGGPSTACRPDLYDVEIIERPGLAPRIAVIAKFSDWALIYTDDFGLNWTFAADGGNFGSDEPLITMAESRREPGVLAIGFAGFQPIHISEDGLDSLVSLAGNRRVEDVAIAGGVEDLLVRVLNGATETTAQESLDGGLTWIDAAAFPNPSHHDAFAFPSVNGASYFVGGTFGVFERTVSPVISDPACEQTVPNSTGFDAILTANGSAIIANDDVHLNAELLPQNVATLFLTSATPGLIINPGGSLGNLCLSGSIGRFTSDLQFSGIAGAASISIDPTALPQPTGTAAATAGSSWYFQAWHRDNVGGVTTSHFTNSVEVVWQ